MRSTKEIAVFGNTINQHFSKEINRNSSHAKNSLVLRPGYIGSGAGEIQDF